MKWRWGVQKWLKKGSNRTFGEFCWLISFVTSYDFRTILRWWLKHFFFIVHYLDCWIRKTFCRIIFAVTQSYCMRFWADISLFCFVCRHSFLKCPNGHTLCSNCKIKVHNCCPTCRLDLGNIRCLALERVAASLELPCKYQKLGCQDIFPYYSKLKHEQNCRLRPYNCPYAGSECSVTGDIQILVGHLKDHHKVDMHDGCTFNHRYVKSDPHEVENATWMLTVSWFVHIITLFS